jgi:DNA invertase Pin-like site-specific DNA recombinase
LIASRESTRDLLNIMATIAEKRAGFRSLGDVWADTTTAHGALDANGLGGLAELECDLYARQQGLSCSCLDLITSPA